MIEVSKKHREKFLKLKLKDCSEVERINGVIVCFEDEFFTGKGADGTCAIRNKENWKKKESLAEFFDNVEIDESELHEDTDNTDIKEGSQSASGDPAGLGESEIQSFASMEPSPNLRSGFCEENYKTTVEETIQSGTEAFGGPADLGESKNEGIVFVKLSPNTNETAEESTLSGTTVSADSAIKSTSEKEVYEDDIKLGKNDAQAVKEEEPGVNAQLNNSTQKNYVRETIPLTVPEELTDSLLSNDDIEGFGVVDEQLMINVFEDREDAARESIKKTLEKFPAFASHKWYIDTWTETNCMKLHSNSAVGGFELHWPLKKCETSVGTIGCLFQSLDGKIYGVTCDHVVDGLDNSSDQFSITVNKVKQYFPKEIGSRMLKPEEAVDIALLPLNESCDVFDFEHDQCDVYSGEISELMGLSVQKNGATTSLTKGEIMSVDYTFKLPRDNMPVLWYKHSILVASSSDAEFSKSGDSGSIVTLCKGDDENTHKAVSMVLSGGYKKLYRGQLRHASVTLPLRKAMDLLLQKEENIGKGYVILSKLGSKTLAKSKENSKNTVGEKIHSATEASDRKLRRRRNTNEIEKVNGLTTALGGAYKTGDKRIASMEISPNEKAKKTRKLNCIQPPEVEIPKTFTAVAGGEAGQIGLQKESQELEKHENVESELIKDANTAEESTLSGTTVSADSAINSTSEKEVYEDDIKPGKNDAQAVNEEEPAANEQFNNSTQKNYVKDTISLMTKDLADSLKSIDDVKGFGVVEKKLMINVMEDREMAAEECIKKVFQEKFPEFPRDKWHIVTWSKTNCMKLHSNSTVGGFHLRWPLKKNRNSHGTIGCFFKLSDGKIYAATCHHVVDVPGEEDELSGEFQICVNGVKQKFPKEIGLRMFKPKEGGVDIALLPLNESCDAFDFEHDECKVYHGEISALNGFEVQKSGVETGLTKGKIMCDEYYLDGEEIPYEKVILVASSTEKAFSKEGDSGSIVTLCKGDKSMAVSMLFAGGATLPYEGRETSTSMTFSLQKAMRDLLKDEENIDKDYVILSKLGSNTLGLNNILIN